MYDYDCYRRQLRAKSITPVIGRRDTVHGSGLGTRRWVIEQTIAQLHWFRRLRIRWEIRDAIHEAFLTLDSGSAVTCGCEVV
ncbi:transposase [Micromonospora sp. WMMD708]|uniref:transposase n=1 Tax=Micromonospora sp. WMMD708 TaxID=3403464 RepID=UPI003BF562AD